MRMIARVAVLAAPLLVVSGLSLAPALADGGCQWGGFTFGQSDVVTSGGEVFMCDGTANGPQWIDAGAGSAGPDVSAYYTPNANGYSSGTVLPDGDGNAWSFDGSGWNIIGSWDDFVSASGTYPGDGGGSGDCGDTCQLQG